MTEVYKKTEDNGRSIHLEQNHEGLFTIRVDAPGERAVSVSISFSDFQEMAESGNLAIQESQG